MATLSLARQDIRFSIAISVSVSEKLMHRLPQILENTDIEFASSIRYFDFCAHSRYNLTSKNKGERQ
jgi:hypothetical protein